MIEKMKRVIGIYMEGDEGIANGRKERHYDQGGYGRYMRRSNGI